MSYTLKRNLLFVFLPPVIVLVAAELWLSNEALLRAADAAYDRSLVGAIKTIDANISTANGGLDIQLPYKSLEFFNLMSSGRVYYKVATEDGLMALGSPGLAAPSVELKADQPVFYDAMYFGEPVRIGAYARMLAEPLYGVRPQRVIIQVAETREARNVFTRDLLAQAAVLDVLLVAVIACLMAFGIVLALRPLQRLRHDIMQRAQDDLAQIDPSGVPQEVRPLVDAINFHIDRFKKIAVHQRQFLDDASHQLRTPLAVLRTQVEYALREPDDNRVREALHAMQRGLHRSIRLVNQMLALARANSGSIGLTVMEDVDLNRVAEEVARTLLFQARLKEQDFGLLLHPTGRILVKGIEPLLHEAVTNLVDNAIRYAPRGGRITLAVETDDMTARISISDSGPGMSEVDCAAIGERFRRGKTAERGGAGLGLAIVKAIVTQHNGQLLVQNGNRETGLTVDLTLPLPGQCATPH